MFSPVTVKTTLASTKQWSLTSAAISIVLLRLFHQRLFCAAPQVCSLFKRSRSVRRVASGEPFGDLRYTYTCSRMLVSLQRIICDCLTDTACSKQQSVSRSRRPESCASKYIQASQIHIRYCYCASHRRSANDATFVRCLVRSESI